MAFLMSRLLWPFLVASGLLHGLSHASVLPEVVLGPAAARGSRGAVASESIECSAIGRDLLARGGNAVDALVGTTFCVGVIGMYHSGIGGGGFVMVRDAEGNYEAVDFRESAPAAAFQDMYQGNVNGSIFGGLSVAVPSEVRGLEYVHTRYGSLPWKTVMAGAIHLARNGFKVSEDLVRYMDYAIAGSYNFLAEKPEWAEDFAPNGQLVRVGDIMTRKRYANTLQKIAEEGPDAFYHGELAESMIETIRKSNGTMTLDDLQSYEVKTRQVAHVTYRGLDLFGIGSPAGGAVCLSILKTMEQYDRGDSADVSLDIHRFDESMRFAYGARLELGDPSYVPNIDVIEADMLAEDKAKEIRHRIMDNQTLPIGSYNPKQKYATESHGTSHIVTADQSGMATSLTTTINLLFGAQIMDPKSGVILNDEMNDFSIPGVRNEFGFEPSEANYIRPNKRPLSSITPVIISFPNGTLYATVGAAGGSRIISSTAQAIWHVVEHNQTMKEALLEPRIHDQLMPNYALVEYKFNNNTVDGLLERGHNITWVREGMSAVQGIRRLGDGAFEAASEPRQRNSGGLTL